jgi:hypothetical protein
MFDYFQVSITLETSETINPRALHPSRRSSPTITKVPFSAFELNHKDLDPNPPIPKQPTRLL